MLHFAPRYGIISPCLNWHLNGQRGSRPNRGPMRQPATRLQRAANDNSATLRGGAALPASAAGANDHDGHAGHDDALLDAALRLFAAHGLSAAQRACEAAEIAADGGDAAAAAWWIAVCATLDGPLGRTAQRALAARAAVPA